MTDFPLAASVNDLDVNETQQMQNFSDWLDAIQESPGLSASQEVTIDAGAIIPPVRCGHLRVDTQNDDAADDLETITPTNVRNEAVLWLRMENASRVPTLKHTSSAANKVNTMGHGDIVFTSDMIVEVTYRTGATSMWYVTNVFYGTNVSAFRSYLGLPTTYAPLWTTTTTTAAARTAVAWGIELCNATSTAITLTLPSAATIGAGKMIYVWKTDTSTNVVSIAFTGGQNANGITTWTLPSQHAGILFISDGSNYKAYRVGRPPVQSKSSSFDAEQGITYICTNAITATLPAGANYIGEDFGPFFNNDASNDLTLNASANGGTIAGDNTSTLGPKQSGKLRCLTSTLYAAA